jgi:hypothetical protein
MGLAAFIPAGLSKLVAATTTASTAITQSVPMEAIRIHSDGPVHFAFGSSTGSSGITASTPTTSVPANGISLLGGAAEVFNIGPAAYLSFITTSSTGASVRITPGTGA